MPFRTAHGVSAKTVRLAIDKGCRLEELSLKDFKSCSDFFENDIFDVIAPEVCVNARLTDGGPAKTKVLEQIEELKRFVKMQ